MITKRVYAEAYARKDGGFRQWLAIGRCVRKGERGLSLWIPCIRKGEPGETDSINFRLAVVFDIGQTAELGAVAEVEPV